MKWIIRAGWLRGWILAVLPGIFLVGCVENKILVKVKKDGSGNIIVTSIASKETVAMLTAQMEEMKKQMLDGGMGVPLKIPEDPFFDEDVLRRQAGRFGSAITFVKAKKYEKAGARGSIGLYAFEDINDVFVNLSSMGPESGMDMAMVAEMGEEIPVAEKETDAFEFLLTKSDINRLKIVLPDYPDVEKEPDAEGVHEGTDKGPSDAMTGKDDSIPGGPWANPQMQMMMAGGNPYGFTGNESEEEIMQKMCKGMKMELAVEVEGTDVTSNASYPHKTEKNRYILFQLDMDKILTSPKARKMMRADGTSYGVSPAKFFAPVRDSVPGIMIETKKEVEIEFK